MLYYFLAEERGDTTLDTKLGNWIKWHCSSSDMDKAFLHKQNSLGLNIF